MEFYPQPRPALYGTRGDESELPTQTGPTLVGPPNYPPAPPFAGDAPDPNRGPNVYPNAYRLLREFRLRAMPYSGLFLCLLALSAAYSLRQFALEAPGFSDAMVGQAVLMCEFILGVFVSMCLLCLGGLEYPFALGALALHVFLGVIFGQWQSPTLWAAVVALLYLLQAPIRHYSIFRTLEAIHEVVHRRRIGSARHRVTSNELWRSPRRNHGEHRPYDFRWPW
jgi:hypothetical protein